ncbi:MAG TPA: hypothetical protein VF797_05915, partial [Noviherbaspirillum sp.]
SNRKTGHLKIAGGGTFENSLNIGSDGMDEITCRSWCLSPCSLQQAPFANQAQQYAQQKARELPRAISTSEETG